MIDVWAELNAVLPDAQRPLVVGIDGGDGAGKTTLADRWAQQLRADGRLVVRASVDGFHHPRAVRAHLLDPWRAGPGASYRTAVHDVVTDAVLDVEPAVVPANAVLLVDGLYLQRPELRDAWDLLLFLDVAPERRVSRMAHRDGLPDDASDEAHQRYLQAFAHYVTHHEPARWADVVVDGNDSEWRLVRCG